MKVYETKVILVTENHITKNNIVELFDQFCDKLSELEDLSLSNIHFRVKSSRIKYSDVDRDKEEDFETNFDNWIKKSQKVINEIKKQK
jgi:hypothetical protein